MSPKDWRKALYAHYTAAPEQVFPQFKVGAMLFFLGMVVIYGGQQLLAPSLEQEITTLIGLLLLGGGFLWAMLAQVRMLIGRLLKCFFE